MFMYDIPDLLHQELNNQNRHRTNMEVSSENMMRTMEGIFSFATKLEAKLI